MMSCAGTPLKMLPVNALESAAPQKTLALKSGYDAFVDRGANSESVLGGIDVDS
jgi:hypothetical protein